jgi:dynein heavy chain
MYIYVLNFNVKNAENLLSDYNINSKKPMDLVIFNFIINHLIRIRRILKLASGHGLLIGLGGTGRSSMVKLATFISDFELFQVEGLFTCFLGLTFYFLMNNLNKNYIEVSKRYTVSDWKTDLKYLMRRAGEKGSDIVFLFNDSQIKDETFLEDITMLLNSSNIPSLFENEERIEIADKVREY